MNKLLLVTAMVFLSLGVFAAGQNDGSYAGEGFGSGAGRGAGQGISGGTGLGDGRGAGQGGGYGRNSVVPQKYGKDDFGITLEELLVEYPVESLEAEEETGLLLLREEEKLARDVYLTLYEVWNYPIFNNIASSEAQHMDTVKILLDRYEIDDPIADNTIGVFSNPELQSLFAELTNQGKQSLTEALRVGATVEDLDIYDLQQQLEATDNDDIAILYQNLMKGSRNHLRSFNRLLERENESYEAQFISPEYLEQFLALNQEIAPITTPEYEL